MIKGGDPANFHTATIISTTTQKKQLLNTITAYYLHQKKRAQKARKLPWWWSSSSGGLPPAGAASGCACLAWSFPFPSLASPPWPEREDGVVHSGHGHVHSPLIHTSSKIRKTFFTSFLFRCCLFLRNILVFIHCEFTSVETNFELRIGELN